MYTHNHRKLLFKCTTEFINISNITYKSIMFREGGRKRNKMVDVNYVGLCHARVSVSRVDCEI